MVEGVAAGWQNIYQYLDLLKRDSLLKVQLFLAEELLMGDQRMACASTQENSWEGLVIFNKNIGINICTITAFICWFIAKTKKPVHSASIFKLFSRFSTVAAMFQPCTLKQQIQTIQTLLHIKMGNKQSNAGRLPAFQRQNWHQIDYKMQPRRQFGNSTLFRNNLTSEKVEEYPIYFHTKTEYNKYLQFFEWRQREDSIVNAKYINVEENGEFCNATHNGLVYIEHIPLRLCNIEDIPYPQNLYVMFATLDGFEKIFYFTGYFTPREDLVCVDGNGSVKVWINADLSKCAAAEGKLYENARLSEEQMVEEIIQMVENNTSDEIEAETTFLQHIWRVHKDRKLTFKQAKQELINYAVRNNTEIPNYFESVMILIDDNPRSEMDDFDAERTRREEQRILAENRRNRDLERIRYQEQRAVDRSREEHFDRQDSIMVNSMPTAGKFKGRVQNQYLPAFKIAENVPQERQYEQNRVVNLPQNQYRQTQVYRSQIQPQKIYSLAAEPQPQPHYPQPTLNEPPRARTNSTFQVKFNYAGNVQNGVETKTPISSQRAHFLPTNSQKKVAEPAPVVSHQIYQALSHPENRLPESTLFCQVKTQQEQIQDKTMAKASKILYSDTTETYELDNEIANDIFKYFGEVKM